MVDLRGRTIAFTSPTSNSGFKVPSVLLKEQFGMEAGRDFNTMYSGKHDNSILGVVNRDYEAAAIANVVLRQMLARDVVSEFQYRTIYRLETFPTTAYGITHSLHPDLQQKIREAFFSFDWEGSGLQREFEEEQFIPITYKEHWTIIRDVDEALGITYPTR